MATNCVLFTAAGGCKQLRIELNGRVDGLPFTLDCSRLLNGSPAWLELPRRYASVLGAKQGAARLIGGGVQWQAVEPVNTD
ncbi:hypothetical protein [Pseudomonas sp. EMN2]|uniref:hypothetical protein n=1 Tax=Pseudomonas sp. EMN2 TaxID=2615212 RepID=UPI00129A7B74|nr:hypothetical protein [Pseudomonas sp. EMN2]